MPSFSNWDDPSGGDDGDFSAPGVGVLSLTQNGGLTSWDGTSMAAPHVAGILLLDEGLMAGDIGTPNAGGYADPLAVIGTPHQRLPQLQLQRRHLPQILAQNPFQILLHRQRLRVTKKMMDLRSLVMLMNH